MSIFLCGDTHGTIDIGKLAPFVGRRDLDENDYLIILGDTAICGFNRETEEATRDFLRQLPMTILFIDGNHENFEHLNSYSVDEWHGGKVHIIEPGMIHLMRGQIFDIDGRTFFTFGGAFSVDRSVRTLGVDWFEEELPTDEEKEEAWENLEAADYTVDYILTHTAPYEVITALGYESHEEALPQVRFFQEIADNVDFIDWYFGHFHEDTEVENFHCLMDEIIELN